MYVYVCECIYFLPHIDFKIYSTGYAYIYVFSVIITLFTNEVFHGKFKYLFTHK